MASNEELDDAIMELANENPNIPTEEGKDARKLLEDANVELAALRTWKERAMPLLRALASADLIERDGWEACHFCTIDVYIQPIQAGHEATCPIVLAKVLLAESEANDAQ
jgi:hypothetical protein